jgi:hypothetical protein
MPSSTARAAGQRCVEQTRTGRMSNANLLIDGCAALFRVHLFGYHVVPMVILDSWPSARFDPDRGYCRIGSLHVFDHLVSADNALLG